MDSIEFLAKKLDELQFEMLENPNLDQKTLLSKITFLKNFLTAEICGNNSTTSTLKLDIARKNLEELESLANEPFWPQSRAKIRTKIAFTKSLLGPNEDLLSTSSGEEKVREIEKESNCDDLSTSCSCTSSCFDDEKEEQVKGEDKIVFSVDESKELKLENGERRLGKLKAMVAMAGVFAAAAVGVAFRSFFGEEGKVYLVPT